MNKGTKPYVTADKADVVRIKAAYQKEYVEWKEQIKLKTTDECDE